MATAMEKSSDLDVHKTEKIEDVSSIYRHHPLSANTTRVLRILPATKPDHSDTISCSLSVISLDPSPPVYRALSYIWGDPSVTRVILVDDHEFEVRINLWNYLSQARKEEYTGPLWVDAVCIDQTNLAERSAQVAIMGQIYSKALEVRAWLGMGTERKIEAMQLLEEDDWQEQAIHLEREKCFSLDQEQLETICELLDSRYWSRIWIIQEYILASCVSVQCGSKIIAGTTLECMVNAAIREVGEFWKSSYDDTDFSVLNETAGYRIIEAREIHTRHSPSPTGHEFAVLLYQSCDSKCTDLHDHVYALLSLDKNASEEIVPDYTKSLSQLFLDVVHFFKTRPTPISINQDDLVKTTFAVRKLINQWGLEGCEEPYEAYEDLRDHFDRLM